MRYVHAACIWAIRRGLDDMQTDRVVPHKQAMRRLHATVGRAAKAKT